MFFWLHHVSTNELPLSRHSACPVLTPCQVRLISCGGLTSYRIQTYWSESGHPLYGRHLVTMRHTLPVRLLKESVAKVHKQPTTQCKHTALQSGLLFDWCRNNPEKSTQTNSQQLPLSYLIETQIEPQHCVSSVYIDPPRASPLRTALVNVIWIIMNKINLLCGGGWEWKLHNWV